MDDITPAHLEILYYLVRGGRIFRHWTDNRWRENATLKPMDKRLTDDLIKGGYVADRSNILDLHYRHLELTQAGRLKAQTG